eukprot:TRINITY_DN3349_c0_g1_i11.p1 TRINITY_DN3349_c0_g1~~TRINITY_DN3349_c0_g1_i11.p1  ORF type:complete len:403 (+),score=73.87 TRINITY_DN3349_c0_g1_i11:558-1766(+)
MDSLSKCGLCSTSYVERTPKILLCGHTWCSFCLDSKQRNGNRVTCPNQKCAKIITPLPKEGASGLPTNIALKELAAQLEEQIEVNCSFQCPEHPTKKVDFFCLSCISPICSFCTKEAHKHHEFEVLESAFEPQRKMVSSQVGMIKVILGQVDKKIDDMKNTVSSLESDKQTTERHLREFFNKIREWIKKRETELLEDLHSSTQKIFKDLATSQENLSTLLISTRQGLHIIDTHLEKINPNYPNNNTPLSQLEFLKSTKMYYDMLAISVLQQQITNHSLPPLKHTITFDGFEEDTIVSFISNIGNITVKSDQINTTSKEKGKARAEEEETGKECGEEDDSEPQAEPQTEQENKDDYKKVLIPIACEYPSSNKLSKDTNQCWVSPSTPTHSCQFEGLTNRMAFD